MSDLSLGFSIREHIRCTKEEKVSCLPIIDEMVGFAELARKEGLLAFEKMEKEHENPLFRAGMSMCVDGVDKITISYNLGDMLIMSDKTGVELLKQYIIASSILDMMNGDHPRLIRRHLVMMLGDEIYNEVMKPQNVECDRNDITEFDVQDTQDTADDKRKEKLIAIKKKERQIYERIHEQAFSFEDIADLSNRTMQRILRETKNDDIAVALIFSSDSLQRAFFFNMSVSRVKMIIDDMKIMGPVCVRDSEQAQQRIMDKIEKLAGEGEI